MTSSILARASSSHPSTVSLQALTLRPACKVKFGRAGSKSEITITYMRRWGKVAFPFRALWCFGCYRKRKSMGQELTGCVKYAQLDPQFMDSLYSVIMECHNLL